MRSWHPKRQSSTSSTRNLKRNLSLIHISSSFDTALAEKLGETLGNECRAENLALLLGPGLNLSLIHI